MYFFADFHLLLLFSSLLVFQSTYVLIAMSCNGIVDKYVTKHITSVLLNVYKLSCLYRKFPNRIIIAVIMLWTCILPFFAVGILGEEKAWSFYYLIEWPWEKGNVFKLKFKVTKEIWHWKTVEQILFFLKTETNNTSYCI